MSSGLEVFFNLDLAKKCFFSIKQGELYLEESHVQETDDKALFIKKEVNYLCNWEPSSCYSSELPTLLICVRDSNLLLKKTTNNIIENEINISANVVIIDDRPSNQFNYEYVKILKESNFSYLKITNKKGFNFSMLNNIAALVCRKLGCKELILWNSDLWAVKKRDFEKLLEKHRKEKATISGAKLLYPPEDISLRKEKINSEFGVENKNIRETVQFGGDGWVSSNGGAYPFHLHRFKDKEEHLVNCDKNVTFVTGAFQIIDFEWFFNTGCMNPSLSKNFQDVDLCLKAVFDGRKVCYLGKDIYFYHDESLTLHKHGKNDWQMMSDSTLFRRIWKKEKLQKLIF